MNIVNLTKSERILLNKVKNKILSNDDIGKITDGKAVTICLKMYMGE